MATNPSLWNPHGTKAVHVTADGTVYTSDQAGLLSCVLDAHVAELTAAGWLPRPPQYYQTPVSTYSANVSQPTTPTL